MNYHSSPKLVSFLILFSICSTFNQVPTQELENWFKIDDLNGTGTPIISLTENRIGLGSFICGPLSLEPILDPNLYSAVEVSTIVD